jgi:hypothetical protein
VSRVVEPPNIRETGISRIAAGAYTFELADDDNDVTLGMPQVLDRVCAADLTLNTKKWLDFMSTAIDFARPVIGSVRSEPAEHPIGILPVDQYRRLQVRRASIRSRKPNRSTQAASRLVRVDLGRRPQTGNPREARRVLRGGGGPLAIRRQARRRDR